MTYGYGYGFFPVQRKSPSQLLVEKHTKIMKERIKQNKAKVAKEKAKNSPLNVWYRTTAKSKIMGKDGLGAFGAGAMDTAKRNWWFDQLEKRPLSWLVTERKNLEDDVKSFPVKSGMIFWASTSEAPLNPKDALVALIKVQTRRTNESEVEALDAQAKSKGFKSAADMLATQDVEKEWYNKKYGAKSPAEIAAYKAMEKEKFGRTSFEQAMSGEHDPQFLGQETDGLAVEDQKAQMQEELELQAQALQAQKQAEEQAAIIAEQQRKKQQNLMLIGGAVGIGLVAFFALRK
tara:strand:- start:1897 stop:2766 length:870 start_codon:yes stop_codon:yes gene_type:complete